jgi:hypothetical protein
VIELRLDFADWSAQPVCRRGVGGKEGLDGELGQRDIDGGAEPGRGADEGELLISNKYPERHCDRRGVEIGSVCQVRSGICGKLILRRE